MWLLPRPQGQPPGLDRHSWGCWGEPKEGRRGPSAGPPTSVRLWTGPCPLLRVFWNVEAGGRASAKGPRGSEPRAGSELCRRDRLSRLLEGGPLPHTHCLVPRSLLAHQGARGEHPCPAPSPLTLLVAPLPCRRLPGPVLGPRLQGGLRLPPARPVRPGHRRVPVPARPLGRPLRVPVRLRPPRPLRPRDRRVPLRARVVVAHVPPPVPVQPRGGALRSGLRLLPVRAGLVGPPLQLPLRLPRLAVRAGVGPLRLPAGLVGPRVPAAVRVRARQLRRRLRPLRLPARLPRRALRAVLPRRPVRAPVPRQVSGAGMR